MFACITCNIYIYLENSSLQFPWYINWAQQAINKHWKKHVANKKTQLNQKVKSEKLIKAPSQISFLLMTVSIDLAFCNTNKKIK